MSDRPIIVVSQRVDRFQARGENRDALDQRLTSWLVALGGLPVPVPNTLGSNLEIWLHRLKPQAVVLSGGNDLGDSLERDAIENTLIDYASYTELPMLGICRGMQMLAQQAGGVLTKITGHVSTRHALHQIDIETSRLPTEVNSFHTWALRLCPSDYSVLATAPDGSIEAIRHNERPWEGWMWHPEREKSFAKSELVRARNLLIRRINK